MTATHALTRTLAAVLALFLNVAPAGAAPPDEVLAELPKATWVAEGKGQRIVYIIIDPNCPSCALLYRNLRTLIEPQDLQIRWVPVAVVNATSLGKAAAILQAPDPLAALRRNEERYHGETANAPSLARGPRLDPIGETYSGGIEEDLPTADTERKLRANERLFTRLDIPVVPTMLFEDRDWHAVIIQGALSPLALRKVFARLP